MHGDNPAGALRAVCVLDPAIDRAKTDVAEYARTRDASQVHELPGKALRWATLVPLRPGEVAIVDSASTGGVAALRAFQLAVTQIESFSRPGEMMSPTLPAPADHRPDRRVWSDDELARIQDVLGFGFIVELGKLAYDRAFAGNAWGGSATFTLPQSSTLGLAQIALRHVELEDRMRSTASSATSSGASTQTPPPNSGADTAAAAKAGTESPAAAP